MEILLVKTVDYEEIVIDFTDFQRTIEIDGKLTNWQIQFNITRTDYNSFVFDLLQSDQVSLLLDGQEYVVQQINPVLSGSAQTMAITATHIFFDIQKKIRVENVIDSDYEDDSKPKHTLDQFLAYVFSGNTYGYRYEILGSFPQFLLITDFGNSDGLSLINTLVDNFDCYVKADNQNIIIMDEANFKNMTQNTFRWLYNTDDINLQLDKTNLRTKCWVYPYKDVNDNYFFSPYIYTSPNVSRFGDSFGDSLDLSSDTDATNQSYTDEKAAKALQDVPEATFTLNYYGNDTPNVGDVWIATIEPTQLDIDVTIIGINDYPFDDTQPAILTFSNAKKDMLNVQMQISNKANLANKKIDFTNTVANNAYDSRLILDVVGEVND